ncbi:hypothetical protein MNAN1_003937 [Malassezia nana]|uniref:Rieske [2Fe-2S] domain protein n=1 Tax=Malassezia nana TaxID=180528 RepID=A0AAF0EUA9_9BASI|nr:hypothetical protein MNAN1_003937 [Malassezia nana]
MARVHVGNEAELACAHRHVLTLQHTQTEEKHDLLLFRMAGRSPTYYCMEARCPHLGASLERAPLRPGVDDVEDIIIVWYVCLLTQPQYDFQLRTGESSTGLRACVYAVSQDEDGAVYIEPPTPDLIDGASVWTLASRSTVSDAWAEPPPLPTSHLPPTLASIGEAATFDPSTVPPPQPAPRTLVAWAVLILRTPSPLHKVAYTRYAHEACEQGIPIGGGTWKQGEWITPSDEEPPMWPPRMPDEQRVRPGHEGKRGRGGTERSRIALLHALANIEQWAIDLAWDMVARAGRLSARHMQTPEDREPAMPLPRAFFADFCQVAYDEAKHFTLLQQRLLALGSWFGALPVHHGLWEAAHETSEDLMARLSIVHLVHEARGLDVNPVTIRKFEAAGDTASVESLRTIHFDEITHVAAGHRWLTFLCDVHPSHPSPVDVFRRSVQTHFAGRLKGPFNVEDRALAGLSRDWYEDLEGTKSGATGVQRHEVGGG